LPDVTPVGQDDVLLFRQRCVLLDAETVTGQRTTALVCGMESHICVIARPLWGATAEKATWCMLASDAVMSSRTELNWRVGLDRMRAAGAVISSTEMMMYELMRSSGSPAFKELLPYLKG